MPATFDAFFKKATATEQNRDGNAPYAYQRHLAEVPHASEIPDLKSQMRSAALCQSQLIHIPTGLRSISA